MPMTSLWCFSIKRFGTQFAGAELFFSMKPFYPINRVLSAHRARHGRPFIHSPVRRLMGCQLGCGCAALGAPRLRGESFSLRVFLDLELLPLARLRLSSHPAESGETGASLDTRAWSRPLTS